MFCSWIRGIALSVSLLSDFSLRNVLYQTDKVPFYFYCLNLKKKSWIGDKCCQVVFCIYWDDYVCFLLYSVNMMNHIDFQMLNQPFPCINCTWCIIIFIYCWIKLAKLVCWGFFVSWKGRKKWSSGKERHEKSHSMTSFFWLIFFQPDYF